MIRYVALALPAATPAMAAEGKPFFSLANTDFIVTIAFFVFIGVLVYFKVPTLLMGLLDKRTDGIRAELDEARKLREEAQAVLASYERKHREVEEQAKAIVEHAKIEAEEAAAQAKKDIENSIARRLQAAQDKIASAEASALKEVKDRAVEIAVAAAAEVIGKQMTAESADRLIEESIGTVDAKLH